MMWSWIFWKICTNHSLVKSLGKDGLKGKGRYIVKSDQHHADYRTCNGVINNLYFDLESECGMYRIKNVLGKN